MFGIVLVTLALSIIATSDPSTRVASIAVAIVVAGLGIDLVSSVVRDKMSPLSHIGPLP